MGRETGLPQLLAPLLLTGGKGADLVIRGNVVLNTLSARSTSTLRRASDLHQHHIRRAAPTAARSSRPQDHDAGASMTSIFPAAVDTYGSLAWPREPAAMRG
jgi:hypothetical protein